MYVTLQLQNYEGMFKVTAEYVHLNVGESKSGIDSCSVSTLTKTNVSELTVYCILTVYTYMNLLYLRDTLQCVTAISNKSWRTVEQNHKP